MPIRLRALLMAGALMIQAGPAWAEPVTLDDALAKGREVSPRITRAEAELRAAEARAVIGKCHRDGEGALSLLKWEGFSFSNVVDIFDGGPLVSAPRDHIRTKRESRVVRVRADDDIASAKRALMAGPRMHDYRCAQARVAVDADGVRTSAGTLRALGLASGDEALVWIDDAH